MYYMHRKLWLNDSNVMTIDKPIPLNEARITTAIFGLSGGPVMLGDDITKIAPERLALIKQVLPRPHETAAPTDLFTRVGYNEGPRVLAAHVKTDWAEWSVVGVFNVDSERKQFVVKTRDLKLTGDGEYQLYDFWDECYAGKVKDDFAVDLAPLSCKIFRVERVREHPWVLSTDMHVRQGELDD